ncbi:MAG: hypothetical protein HYW07_21010 [Candidatus Latescibacteria bacterium]|nr:hypothetical protein [Candidatus Latescibacterota bacterium]
MSAKFARTLLTALSVSALILAGCGDDDEDTSPTGNGGGGGTGGAINSGNVALVQGALTNVFTKALAQGPGTHNGAKSGTVKITLSTGKPAQVGLTSVKYSVVFTNYSDDGLLYIDGPLTISGNPATQSFKYVGDLTLSGTYAAKVGIDLTIEGGKPSGTITIDGQKFPVSG